MEEFRSYLEQEGTPTNETVHEFRVPVISRFDEVKGKRLHVIKVKDGANFKRQAKRLILDTTGKDKQYISFIDPKGLLHIRADDPKIEFYKTIKELETRLAHTADNKTVILNSFIMSGSSSSRLRQWWNMDQSQREEMNVYTLDNHECVQLMIEKMLQQ